MNERDFTLSVPSGGTVHTYRTPLVEYTVKTNTTDLQTVDSDYSNPIHQEIPEECETKVARDERVEKHVCEIELRGEHLTSKKNSNYLPGQYRVNLKCEERTYDTFFDSLTLIYSTTFFS